MPLWRRWGSFLGQLALPVLVGLLAAPRVEVGGTLLPWAPVMADLDVYIHTGQVVMAGGDIIAARAPGTGLAFVYPPFVALLCVPLALLPVSVVQLGWVLLCVLTVYAVLHRIGLAGWVLSGVTAAVVWFVEPVHATIGFGQLGTVLVALVVLDLVPGPRLAPWLFPRLFPRPAPGALSAADAGAGAGTPTAVRPGRRGWLPVGSWSGLAAGSKLTPGLFLVMLLIARQWRAAIALAVVSGVTVTIGALVFPSASAHFVGTLLGGDTRTTEGLYYLTNQSLLGAVTRVAGEQAAPYGLPLAALTALGGAWVAARAYRRGALLLAVSLCGVATLLASPISWTHHFVWVLPLAIALLGDQPLSKRLPDAMMVGAPALARRYVPGTGLRLTGWLFVGWVSAAVFLQLLPYGGDAEPNYLPWQLAISVLTPVLGLAVLLAAALDLRHPHPGSDDVRPDRRRPDHLGPDRRRPDHLGPDHLGPDHGHGDGDASGSLHSDGEVRAAADAWAAGDARSDGDARVAGGSAR